MTWLRAGATCDPFVVRDGVLVLHVVCARWLITTLAFLQDALCEVPSDWLDQGQSDLYVPTVPDGFMRELVIHNEAYTHSSACTRLRAKRPPRSIFYHFFHTYDAPPGGGPSVERKALLRAAVNPDDADADDTVEAFLRSSLHTQMGKSLQQSDFDFYDAENCGPCALNAPAPASRSLPPLGPASLPKLSPAETQAAKEAKARPRDKPFHGGALKCCRCGRWHNVPEEVMKKVKMPSV